MFKLLLLVLSLSIIGFLNSQESIVANVKKTTDVKYYSNKKPVDLLNDLENLHALNKGLGGNITLPSVQGWVRAADAVSLIEYISDDSPSLRANSVLSSMNEGGASTVGKEALRMIQGYTDSHLVYPPNNSSPMEKEKIKGSGYFTIAVKLLQ